MVIKIEKPNERTTDLADLNQFFSLEDDKISPKYSKGLSNRYRSKRGWELLAGGGNDFASRESNYS